MSKPISIVAMPLLLTSPSPRFLRILAVKLFDKFRCIFEVLGGLPTGLDVIITSPLDEVLELSVSLS